MWRPASTVFGGHGGIESTSQSSYLPLAWGGARNGESVSEHAVRSVRARGESGTGRPEGADHKNRGSVGKPAGSLLEVRAPVGRDLEAKLPAVDKSRATETAFDLITSHSLQEVTILLRRTPTSVRTMLHRLGASARMGQDWFTKHTLAEALHVRADEVQKWIDDGLLRCRIVDANGLQRHIIDAEDFCDFCKQHRGEIVGRRLNTDRLSFVQTFVFPPSHMELLPVREAKKEQAAYDEQSKKQAGWEADAEDELDATA